MKEPNPFLFIGVVGALVAVSMVSFGEGYRKADFHNVNNCYFEVFDSVGYGTSIRLWNHTIAGKGECQRLQEVCEKQIFCRSTSVDGGKSGLYDDPDVGRVRIACKQNLDCAYRRGDCSCNINVTG